MGPPKEAALYFDEVFPLDFSFSGMANAYPQAQESDSFFDPRLHLPIRDPKLTDDVVRSLLPRENNASSLYFDNYISTTWITLAFSFRGAHKSGNLEKSIAKLDRQEVHEVFKSGGADFDKVIDEIRTGNFRAEKVFVDHVAPRINATIDKIGFSEAPLWTPTNAIQTAGGEGLEPAYAMTLRDLKIVDPSQVSWEKLIELRRDTEAMVALKRFRLYFDENFAGKSASYIEDKLSVALDDHERAAKSWGIDLAERSFSMVSSKEGIALTALGAISGAILGAPVTLAAGTGIALLVGGVGIEVRKAFREKNVIKTASDLSYLSALKRLV